MKGTVLYPLNQLKDIDPEVFVTHRKKYIGRENIQQQSIPELDCLWNDVLHFAPVHPADVKKGLQEAGSDLTGDFYQIDPHMLDPKYTVIYLYCHKTINEKLLPNNFVSFNPDDLEQYSHLPRETIDDYKKLLNEGKAPFLYHRVPHILYKGTLDISGCTIISV